MVGWAQMFGKGEETHRDQPKHPSKGAVEDMDRRTARRDKSAGSYVQFLFS